MSSAEAHPLRGTIFDIQRFSINDGPGIRTTVFLKGCPLHCLWCHNPESLDRLPEISYNPALCIICSACVAACPEGCHTINNGAHHFDRTQCTRCGLCTDACCTGVLDRIGNTMTIDDIMAVVLRDRPFYETSGGGMTLSGGEPLAQPTFAAALLDSAKRAGFHTCVETSGAVPFSSIETVLDFVDLFLYDIKATHSASLLRATGASSNTILDNLKKLNAFGASIILRCPIIPNFNDNEAHFQAIADLARTLHGIRGIDVLPYHPLGTGKKEHLGKSNTFTSEMPSDATVRNWIATIQAYTPNCPVQLA